MFSQCVADDSLFRVSGVAVDDLKRVLLCMGALSCSGCFFPHNLTATFFYHSELKTH